MSENKNIIYVYEENTKEPVAVFFNTNDAQIFIEAKTKNENKNYYTKEVLADRDLI